MNINNLQLYRGKKFAGLVDSNKLANAFLTEPETITKVMSFIFGRDGNPIDLLTGGLGRVKYINNREYQWALQGEIERTAVIVDAMGSDSGTPGKYGATFRLKLGEKLFVSGEVVAFDDRDYSAIVFADPVEDGEGWIYVFKNTSENPDSFIDPTLCAAGKELSKDYTAYEEGSSRSGTTYYNTPFMFENQLTIHRKSRGITGSAASDVMIIAMTNPDTKKTSYLWADYQEWIFLRQWAKEKNRLYVHSKYNGGTIAGDTGRPVFMGAGLRQQIAPANIRYYNHLTENIIREFLMDLSYNVLDSGQRKFVALCGEGFMDLFDRAMKDVARGWQLVDTHFVTGTGQNLTLGGQFTTYKGLNGVELTMIHNPEYDNTITNRKLHPITGKPEESYRATILDFGFNDGESNIQLVAKQGREMVMWHTGGSTGPDGPSTSMSNVRSNTMDGYECHALTETGIMVKNPLSCGELIFDSQA